MSNKQCKNVIFTTQKGLKKVLAVTVIHLNYLLSWSLEPAHRHQLSAEGESNWQGKAVTVKTNESFLYPLEAVTEN